MHACTVKIVGWRNQTLSRGNGGGNTSLDAPWVVNDSLPYGFDNMATVPMECDGIPVAVGEALQKEMVVEGMEVTPEKKHDEKPNQESQEPHQVHVVFVCVWGKCLFMFSHGFPTCCDVDLDRLWAQLLF